MIRRCVTSVAALLLADPVCAQDERPTGYPRSANEASADEISGRAVSVSAVYTAEVRSNVRGGITRGTRYLDNIDLQVAVDWEQLAGWRGARLFVYGLYDNGVSLSDELVGDVQTVSNIETGVRAVRLFESWLEQDIGRVASIKVGLYNLNSEFDTTQSGGLFLLSSHGIGPDFSQSGRNGPSIFPVTSLAVRGEVKLDDHWLARAAVLDGVPGDPAHAKRTVVRLSTEDGALIAGELNYLNAGTKAAIGIWTYTGRFDDVLDPVAAGRGNSGAYVFVEQRAMGDRDDDPQGLAGWLRFGVADARFNAIDRYLGGGLVYTALFAGRSDDQIGISFASARFGDRYRRAQSRDGMRVRGSEVVIEAAYNAILAPWFSIQPDVQYVVHPGGVPGRRDALVVGVRVKIGR